MHRRLLNLVAIVLFAASSSCCEHRYNHSVCRAWCDYNSFREPALAFEQFDHLPYPPAQVGYYRWMYDKDPGHQLAALGPVTAPPVVVPQCVPSGDNPFEYQVAFPSAIPRETDSLWSEGQPEPINALRVQPGEASKPSPPTGKESQLLTVPMAPVLPPAAPKPAQQNRSTQPPPGVPLPGFESAPPPPRPVDEDVPPILGPSSQENPNVRLTTGSPAPQAAAAPSTNTLWPR